jgi:hypothetical protein
MMSIPLLFFILVKSYVIFLAAWYFLLLFSNSPSIQVAFSYKERKQNFNFYSCYNFVTVTVMTEKNWTMEVT